METLLRSRSKQVKVSPQSGLVIIGEKINPTGRKKLAAALQAGDLAYVRQLAQAQVDAGADILDVNVGVPGVDEPVLMKTVVGMLAESFDVPLCLDSADPKTLAAGLSVAPGKVLINSVNGKPESLAAVLPLAKEHGAALIGLTMNAEGIPATAEGRLAAAETILEAAAQVGIPAEDMLIDPLVLTVGAESQAAVITLQTIALVKEKFGVNINIGASNVSFGLPERDTINLAFLALAAGAGATCAITDPLKYARSLRAVDLLLGRDNYAMRYVKYCRLHPVDGK
jgi:5-methyltetrahydrofolate--homocysteine methyltransferase